MLISPCIVNQFLKMFQQDDIYFLQYFNPCKWLYMFRVKHSPMYTVQCVSTTILSVTVCHYQML
jgi:hypothetical protein